MAPPAAVAAEREPAEGKEAMFLRTAFTLIELLIVVVVLGILTLAALPNSDAAAQQEADAAARMIEADVAYARSLAVARPDQRVLLVVDGINNNYSLKTKSPGAANETAVTLVHPATGRPYVVQFGATGNPAVRSVRLYAEDLGGDSVLVFDPSGGTDQDVAAIVQLAAGNARREIKISPQAGRVTTSNQLTTPLTPIPPGLQVAAEQAALNAAKDAEKEAENAAKAAGNAAPAAAPAAGNAAK